MLFCTCVRATHARKILKEDEGALPPGPSGRGRSTVGPPVATKSGFLSCRVANDEWQTTREAWQAIAPYFEAYKKKTVWMPFYYDGACADHLRSLGFVNVIHRQEDFFERVLDLKFLRGIDLIWDNPPYTAPEMKERVLRALAQCGKPFVMLLPISVLHVGFVRDIIDMKRVQALIPRRVHVRKSGEEILPFKYLCWFCFGTKLPRDLIFVNDAKPEHEEPPLTTAAPKKRRKLRRKKGSAALQRLPDVCDESHKSPEIVGALAALAECASRLQCEPLKTQVCQATRRLLLQVEGECKNVVQALVDALLRPSCDAVAYDQLWSLRHIGKQSEVARAWIAEKGGLCAVAEAMARHPEHAKLQEEGAWIGYVLKGTGGFVELLKLTQAMPGNLPGTMAVQQATFRAIRELSEQQRERGKEGSAAWSEADLLVLGILTSMRSHSQPTSQFLCECFKVLNELIHDQAQRGMLFMQHGGGKALLEALSLPLEPFACLAGIWFMAVLVQGNSTAATELRNLGALDCLVKCGQSLPNHQRDTMRTLGQVGGPLTVVRLMKSCPNNEGLSVSLRTLSKLTWELPLEDFQQQLPEVLKELLEILRLVDEQLPKELGYALQALGGVAKFYSSQVPPGALREMDEAVNVELKALQSPNPEVAKAACTCLGHVASEFWCGPLQQALPSLQQGWLRANDSKVSCGDLRDLMWAAGNIAGLPILVDAMRQRPQSADLQFASLSAMADLCDEAVGPTPGAEAAVLVVTSAMQLHRAVANVQVKGCEVLGYLCQQGPAPPEAWEAVVAALRRFPCRYPVVSNVMAALRRWLEPVSQNQEAFEAAASKVETLRKDNFVTDLQRVLKDFVRAEMEIIENSLFVYSLLAGIPALLKEATDGGLVMKSATVQVLCDLCRSFQHLVAKESELIRRCVPGLLQSELTAGREGELSQEVVELQRRCEMLNGLLA
ncbi:unnamed protein product [Durusdinium trenchii]|uniref:Uncharacterized protein n=1 Tax=Durusdinium trenchii TaxID=1381693 RepID=A0ABP0PGU8_9DINO